MSSGKKTAPTVSVLAEHVSDHLSVFVVAEDTDAKRPANGGLRVLNYPCLLYTSPSPRDSNLSRMPSSA